MLNVQDNPFEQPVNGTPRPSTHRVRFSGSGAEYFRIWIVNVALSLLTLGIYSAWAKVRRLNYFYRQTSLAESSFEYHGQPMAILKGRILAIVLLALWQFSPQIHPVFFAVVFVAALLVFPWLITSALRFRLHNSSYRGLRLSFHGSASQTAKVFYLSGLLMLVTFGMALPYFVWRTKKYFFDNAAYGTLRAALQVRAGRFFRVYILTGLTLTVIFLLAGGLALAFLARSLSGEAGIFSSALDPNRLALLAAVVLLTILIYLGGFAYIRARLHVLCWDGLELDGHRFRCDMNAGRFALVAVRNLALTMLTLGLYKPFSDIQLTQLLSNSISLDLTSDLDSVLASTQAETRAGGEETAELFDMDVGL